jgi:hypothetical protein
LVPRRGRELQGGSDQPVAERLTARSRVHEQDPQLGRARLRAGDAEHAARSLAVQLGDPGAVPRVIGGVGVVGHDPSHQRLEAWCPIRTLWRTARRVP